MKENLHRFFRAARGAGVHVSPAESIDAMRAVAAVGVSDRVVLRDSLLLTLAKSEDEKKALGACFDLFFAQAEPAPAQSAEDERAAEDTAAAQQRPPQGASGPQSGNLGPLAQMLLSQDRNEISAAIANAAGATGLTDIRYFTQRGLFSSRMLETMGIQRLRDDLDALTESSPPLAERLQGALDALRETV